MSHRRKWLDEVVGRKWLDEVVRTCAYHDYSVAFEFNHSSWFQDLTYNLLRKRKAAIVWSSFSSRYCSSPIITADFVGLVEMNENGLRK
ncbi:MAG: DUF72 domain-containing protein [Candidatus Nitrosopolaris sp.]